MDFNEAKRHLIFEVVTGSRAYGLNRPDSDWDIRGVFIAPEPKHHIGLSNVGEVGMPGEDYKLFEFRKFVTLLTNCNPSLIELLYINPRFHRVVEPLGRKLLDFRHVFLSQRVIHSFSGYAYAQLKRIERHNRWLNQGEPAKPNPEDYGAKFVDGSWTWVSPYALLKQIEQAVQPPAGPEPGVFEQAWLTSGNASIALTKVRALIADSPRGERKTQYEHDLEEYQHYQTWVANRNPARAELERKYGYDCYAEETEFLTDSGWKHYDDIVEADKLATINPESHQVEYQNYSNRVKHEFSGKLISVKQKYTSFTVTPNHKVFTSNMHMLKKYNMSRLFKKECENWNLTELQSLIESNKSAYHMLIAPNPNFIENDFITDDYLKMMGLYVSEGSILKSKNKTGIRRRGISISQLSVNSSGRKVNKIDGLMGTITEYSVKKYTHYRKSRDRYEMTYNIYNHDLAERLFKDCGEYSKNKRLPWWVTTLSQRQAELLISTMLIGDGTRKKHSSVYYTTSKDLANSLQALAVVSGFVTKLWYYPQHRNIYQLYISAKINTKAYVNLSKKRVEQRSNYKYVPYNGNVVCFEVPNSILVTRINGMVAFQGNSKHATQLVRLFEEARQLVTTGDLHLPMDWQYARKVLNGEYTYEEVVAMAYQFEAELKELVKSSRLPNKPPVKLIEQFLVDTLSEYVWHTKKRSWASVALRDLQVWARTRAMTRP